MANLNRVLLMGNLTRDPQVRQTPNSMVCQFGLAINRRRTDGEGNRQEETTFVDVEAWGRMGEVIGKYLTKGDPIFIERRLKLDRWKDPEGEGRSKLKIVAEGFQFVSTPNPSEQNQRHSDRPADRPPDRTAPRQRSVLAGAT